jgi:hypothetical protein
MNDDTHVAYGVAFGASLVLSWTVVTAVLVLSSWSDDRSAPNLGRWAGLWFATVAGPTISSLIVHRRLNELVRSYPDIPRRIRRDLRHVRWTFLMFGTMSVLIVFGLGLR